MPLLLLLLLTVACLPEDWRQLWDLGSLPANIAFSTALTWAGIGVVVFAAARLARWTERALATDPHARDAVLHRYATLRLYHFLLLIGIYISALCFLDWGWTIQSLSVFLDPVDTARTHLMLPGSELLLLSPFLAGLILSWAWFYDADRAFNRTSD